MNIYYIVTLFFLIFASKANFLVKSNLAWFGFEVFMIVIALSFNRIKKKDVQFFILSSVIYFIYILFRFKLNQLPTDYFKSDVFYFFKFVLTSYLFCLILKERALYYLIKVISHLALISIVFYVLQFYQDGAIVKAIGKAFESITVETFSLRYTNFLIFTYDTIHYYRNSGFCWEPGAFGSFLTLALMFNFLINDFKLNKEALIITLAILTTVSTTAYLGAFILYFLRYRVLSRGSKITIIIFAVIFALAIPNVPFLGEKVVEIYEQDIRDLKELEQLSVYYEDVERQIPLNRFASVIFLYEQFNWKLFLGVSNQYDEYYINEFNVNISNGIMDFITKFGLLGLMVLLYRYGKLCRAYLRKTEYVCYSILILLILSFGEPILMLPICVIFIFLPTFKKQDFTALSFDYRSKYLPLKRPNTI
ncbi:hypothetical protein [Maribacter sp. UBA4516]|uniref:hypothetical protein n=1 Tax=Maribacter sp. UBA4516 TaxID=1946804 RepID=UPI0025796C6E|nr:hypothetical protein [Maribacter sp. UBA4516]|tara:strand:+ start:107032 stop:108294 length:1263 start_codon:yes stop_codon:yes gene_type:complete